MLTSNFSAPINVIIMVTKKYIVICAYTNVMPNVQQLKQKITIFEEGHLAYKDMDKEHIFFFKMGETVL